MELKREWTQCRLCFLPTNDYINLFENTSPALDIIEVLKSYFHDEVTEMDVLPKLICCHCYDRVVEFHKFAKQVLALRQDYLDQHLNGCVKQEAEDVNDFEIAEEPHEESHIHTESICVASVAYNLADEFDDNKVTFESVELPNGEPMSDASHDDDIDSDADIDGFQSDDDSESDPNILHAQPTEIEINLLPRHISEVTPVQKQQIVSQYFDMNCNYCDEQFQEFEEVAVHYRVQHRDLPEGYLKCVKCELKYKVRKKFNDHIVWHLNPDVFKCNICNLSYKSRQTYGVHRFIHRSNVLRSFECDICKKTFARKNLIRSHIMSVHASKMKYQCDICRESFKSEQDLEGHISVAHNDSHIDLVDNIHLTLTPEDIERVLSEHFDLTCTEDDCSATFKNFQDAQQHYTDVHGIDGFLRCCQSRFTRSRLAEEHVAWHLNPDVFRCTKCWKAFRARAPLKRHMIMHEAEGLYCKVCRLGFRKRKVFNEHMKRHIKKPSGLLKCDHCDKRFAKRYKLIEHMKVIHEPELEAQRKKNEDFKVMSKYFDMKCDWDECDIMLDSLETAKSHYWDYHRSTDFYIKCCNLKFKEQNLIKDHIAWHINPDIFKCVQCGESLQTRKGLYYHTFKHRYPTNKKFICDMCKKCFISKSRVKAHIYDVHISRRKKCMICAELFTTRESLENHLRLAHVSSSADVKKKINALGKYLSKEKIAEIIDIHFGKSCDLCGAEVHTYLDAQKHYLEEHKIRDGYLICCNMKHKSYRAVVDHAHWHHDPDTFKCFLCAKVYTSRGSLIAHINNHHHAVHMGEKHYSCPVCRKYYSRQEFYQKHIESTHPEYIQPESSTKDLEPENIFLRDETTIEDHEKKHEIEKKDTVDIPEYFDMTCSKCPAIFESFQEARDHYLDVHSFRSGFVRCCQLRLKTVGEVRDHIEWHSNPDRFRCDICNLSFPCRRLQAYHNLRHRTKEFACNVCDKKYLRRNMLREHMQIHEKRERTFICDICQKGFYNENYLKSHIERRHNANQSHICEFCAKGFNTKLQLKAHLRRHSDSASQKPKQKFECTVCHAWLASRGSLQTHMLRHNSEPQKCDQCDKISPNIAALKHHVRSVHCESNFKCHICGKSFKLSATLEDHIATHQDNKIYKCCYCEETFTWRTNMYKHRKKNHYLEWLADKEKKNSESGAPS